MLDDIAAEIGSMQVSTRNPAPAEGSTVEGLVTDFKVIETKSYGRLAIFDVLVTKSEGGENPNTPGTTVSKKYYIDDNDAGKKAMARKNMRKDLCTLAKTNQEKVSKEEFTKLYELAKSGTFNGTAVKFEPFEYIKKQGKDAGKTVTLHNFSLVFGKNDPKEITERAKALSQGADPASLMA